MHNHVSLWLNVESGNIYEQIGRDETAKRLRKRKVKTEKWRIAFETKTWAKEKSITHESTAIIATPKIAVKIEAKISWKIKIKINRETKAKVKIVTITKRYALKVKTKKVILKKTVNLVRAKTKIVATAKNPAIVRVKL